MATILCFEQSIVYNDYLQKGQTINNECYVALWYGLKDEISKKLPHLNKKKVLFHQDTASYCGVPILNYLGH